jgi:hypothetical protein
VGRINAAMPALMDDQLKLIGDQRKQVIAADKALRDAKRDLARRPFTSERISNLTQTLGALKQLLNASIDGFVANNRELADRLQKDAGSPVGKSGSVASQLAPSLSLLNDTARQLKDMRARASWTPSPSVA